MLCLLQLNSCNNSSVVVYPSGEVGTENGKENIMEVLFKKSVTALVFHPGRSVVYGGGGRSMCCLSIARIAGYL